MIVNTRVMALPMTGVQRYVQEVLPALGAGIQRVAPRRPCRGLSGHAWEQLVLPRRVHGQLLWSPSNTGPLACPYQVVTVHDLAALDHPEWLNPRFAAWYRFLLPRLLRRARRVIAISEFTRQRILALTGVRPERVVAILHGLDARFSPRPAAEVDQVRAALALPDRYVLALGSLEPRKNLATLLQAWGALPATSRRGCRLVLAGGAGAAHIFAPSRLALPEDALALGRVPDAALPALYTGALAFVFPSFYEGFGKPPLEAMACGAPVLTSNLTALPEIVADAALCANPYDGSAWTAGLDRLLRDSALREDLAARGRRRAAAFGWDRAAAATRAVFEAAS